MPRLILVEAKGYTGWSNRQLASKARRLALVLTKAVRAHIDMHVVLAGAKPSAGLDTSIVPPWMKAEDRAHFLEINDPGPRRGVRRFNPNTTMASGKTIKVWQIWQPVQRVW